MRLLVPGIALVLGLAACAAGSGGDRLPLGQSVGIANAGTQISVQRAGAGIVTPMVQNPDLQAAAQFHADDMVRSGQFRHTGSNGSSVSDRVASAGYRACAVAENIAQGQPDIRSVISAWMASPEHRANLLNAELSQFGFARNGDTWVLVLARPC